MRAVLRVRPDGTHPIVTVPWDSPAVSCSGWQSSNDNDEEAEEEEEGLEHGPSGRVVPCGQRRWVEDVSAALASTLHVRSDGQRARQP